MKRPDFDECVALTRALKKDPQDKDALRKLTEVVLEHEEFFADHEESRAFGERVYEAALKGDQP